MLLEVDNLSVRFASDEGPVQAVDGVSFSVEPGEVVGIVGESGCGKSATAMSIPRLLSSPPATVNANHIRFNGADLLSMPIGELRKLRGKAISVIFQEPMTALSPLQRIGNQLVEIVRLHETVSKKEAWARGEDWLNKVGIPDAAERMHAWPHELSGGMRQRVMIAMALILSPQLIIADEPTTALDVTIQAQVFQLMLDLKAGDTSILLITHDMGVIWELCQRVIVMYASRIVESGPVDAIFAKPRHPYTQGLLAATPSLREKGQRLPAIPGQVPSPRAYPPGCHFAERCAYSDDACLASKPALEMRTPQHAVACFHDENLTPSV
ncbi:MAG: oligopeptide/dipeptide ABC transporter ATP-binding protein [Rhodothermales bacterium]|jgi:oligopeptide/dipeptide ABC transporter ATP-binding protein